MKKYQNLLFDLDHTLWDFDRNSRETLEELFEDFNLGNYFQNLEVFLDKYHRINSMLWDLYGRGKISKNVVKYDRFSKTLSDAGNTDKNLANQLADEYVAKSPCKTHLINGSLEVLQSLRANYKMFIITNGFTEVQYKKINLSGLGPFFDKVFTSEDAGFQKPDPGFFEFAFTYSGLNKSNSLVIGDNLITDIGGAVSFGIDTVFYNPDYKKDFIGSTYIISQMGELLSIL